MSNQWFRLWHDMPTDPKWRVISKRSGRPIPEVMSVYLFVLTNASCNDMKRGVTHNLEHDDIAAALDLDAADVTSIIEAMQGKVLDSDVVIGWEKRQPKREDNSTERVRAHRETQCNAVKRTETLDTDKDTDTDKEKKEEGCGSSQKATKPPPSPIEKIDFYRGEVNESAIDTRAVLPISGDFDPPDEWAEFAGKLGLSSQETLIELEKFVAYFTVGRGAGKRRSKRGWRQSWSTWISKTNERRK